MRSETLYGALFAGAVGVTLTGCASTAPQAAPEVATPREHRQPGERRGAVSHETIDRLSLPQALALALLRSPALEAFAYEVRAAEARVLQARALPNPELELEVEEYDRGGEGLDPAEMAVVLGQRFELGGKRRWRTRRAEAEKEAAGWDYENKRVDVLASTAQRFVAVIAAQRRLELAKSTVGLAEETSRAVAERVKAGKEPPLQASKTTAELEMARIGVLEAENALDASRRALASAWGDEQPRFGTVEGDLDRVTVPVPSLDTLRARLPASPGLARWASELRLQRAELSAQKAARVPDLEAFVGLQRFEEDGTDSLAFGIGLPLPLFDRNRGNIAAAEYDLAKAEAERKAAKTTLLGELAGAHADLMSAHRRVLTLRSKVVPAMQEAFEAAREGYKQGKYGFLDMLDAQRGLVEAKGALVDALADHHAAVAGIQRITGTSIEKLTNTEQEQGQ